LFSRGFSGTPLLRRVRAPAPRGRVAHDRVSGSCATHEKRFRRSRVAQQKQPLGRGTDLDAFACKDREDFRMPMLLPVLPHRRRSRRSRSLRARLSFAAVVLVLTAYIAWQSPLQPLPSTGAGMAIPAAVGPAVEPEQSIATEGALVGRSRTEDADRYVAER
jgi:hypothetical protein